MRSCMLARWARRIARCAFDGLASPSLADFLVLQFFSYCFGSLLPDDLDIYLVELDINDEPYVRAFVVDVASSREADFVLLRSDLETLRDADALMRGLLQLPQEPAVIRVSVFQVIFEELARGVIANLVTSQYFDVPIIGCVPFRSECLLKCTD